MVKLIAALTMLIDHIGVVFSPVSPVYRVVGRLSMPLFAYCIARGFYYSNQHGTVKKYIMNMLLLSLVSQLPYFFMTGKGLNIGFTWMLSLLLLMLSAREYNAQWKRVLSIIIAGLIIFIHIDLKIFPVDYGVSGVVLPLLFYLLIKVGKEGMMDYVLTLLVVCFVFVLSERTAGSAMQIFSVCAAPVLTVSKKWDNKIRFPKWVFYAFFPMHIMALLMIKQLM